MVTVGVHAPVHIYVDSMVEEGVGLEGISCVHDGKGRVKLVC